jgi:hypothetical protein
MVEDSSMKRSVLLGGYNKQHNKHHLRAITTILLAQGASIDAIVAGWDNVYNTVSTQKLTGKLQKVKKLHTVVANSCCRCLEERRAHFKLLDQKVLLASIK